MISWLRKFLPLQFWGTRNAISKCLKTFNTFTSQPVPPPCHFAMWIYTRINSISCFYLQLICDTCCDMLWIWNNPGPIFMNPDPDRKGPVLIPRSFISSAWSLFHSHQNLPLCPFPFPKFAATAYCIIGYTLYCLGKNSCILNKKCCTTLNAFWFPSGKGIIMYAVAKLPVIM